MLFKIFFPYTSRDTILKFLPLTRFFVEDQVQWYYMFSGSALTSSTYLKVSNQIWWCVKMHFNIHNFKWTIINRQNIERHLTVFDLRPIDKKSVIHFLSYCFNHDRVSHYHPGIYYFMKVINLKFSNNFIFL